MRVLTTEVRVRSGWPEEIGVCRNRGQRPAVWRDGEDDDDVHEAPAVVWLGEDEEGAAVVTLVASGWRTVVGVSGSTTRLPVVASVSCCSNSVQRWMVPFRGVEEKKHRGKKRVRQVRSGRVW